MEDIRWSLLTNHARVLSTLVQDPACRVRTIAEHLKLTERAVHNILKDLENDRFISKTKEGRRNSYTLHLDRSLPNTESGLSVAQLFRMLGSRPAVFLSIADDLQSADELLSEEMTAARWESLGDSFELSVLEESAAAGQRLKARERAGIDLSRSFFVTDDPNSAKAARTSGCSILFLMTGSGAKVLEEVPLEIPVFHTLLEAISWISRDEDLDRSIDEGAEVIRAGGLTVFPTETVYGLGADAMNEEAVRKIFRAKDRPYADPLISHVSSRDMVIPMVQSICEKAEQLMDAFWPGPLTLVFPKSPSVPDVVTAGNPTVAIRMPSHPVARDLISRAGVPVAAPSANSFGRTSPTTAEHVIDQLEGRFDAIIDGGACRVGVESTVLSLLTEPPTLLRPGGVTIEELESVVGPVAVKGSSPKVFDSPGMFPSHYAPKTPMVIVDDPSAYAHEEHIAVLLFTPDGIDYRSETFILSRSADPAEAAANLYDMMRRIDRKQLRLIVAQRLPSEGIGAAVNDRMGRAAT